MSFDSAPPDLKKQRHVRGVGGQGTAGTIMDPLPSKEQLASKGLEAKVDMATHGQQSWALTGLGSWRDRSLNTSLVNTEKSAAFVRARQREAKRAMLGTTTAAAMNGVTGPLSGAPETLKDGGSNGIASKETSR